ncbi:MAG TPA: sugar ABC transporter permease [Acidimicrobiales bacterium]|nr:sugar ABC transporter permease [Acidimicrobiales bacterium]
MSDGPETQAVPTTDPAPAGAARWARLLGAVAVVVGLPLLARWAYTFMKDGDANRFAVVGVAILLGVLGVFALFWLMDEIVDRLPHGWREGARPYVFVGPALVILSVFLIYPVVNTVILSFKDRSGDSWVGLDNYRFVFTDESMLRSLRNTGLWIVVVPAVALTIGLLFATLADRLQRGESLAKSLIFLPMAISFVGAAVTFRLIYSYRPAGFGTNIGVLNAIWQGLGNEPVPWLTEKPWNNLMLMVIMVWMQTGFAMVVLSSAIKAIPEEITEAARIDGATEWQVFRHITIPSILPTIVVVTTYMVINALKVFDIVFVMGSPENNGTEVVAERMLTWFFLRNNDGYGAAVAVVLFLAVIPVMVWNVRRFRAEEAIR